MRKREKEQWTYDSAVSKEERLTKELAAIIIDAPNLSEVELNTVAVHRKVGAVKVLREIIFK